MTSSELVSSLERKGRVREASGWWKEGLFTWNWIWLWHSAF